MWSIGRHEQCSTHPVDSSQLRDMDISFPAIVDIDFLRMGIYFRDLDISCRVRGV